ncbi:MAG TPA: hypothetical protein VIL74_24580 [Pyrinomonadaceae bacterium]
MMKVIGSETSAYCAGNLASANGSGHNGSMTLSFGAFNHGSNNFTGQATFIDEAANTKLTVDVECLTVAGNQATFKGSVRKSTNSAFPTGIGVSFTVVDNGEGAGSPPDQFSPPYLGGCGAAETAAPGLLVSDAGNIQVRFVAPDKDCTKCPFGTHCAGNGECVGGGGGGGGGGGSTCPIGTRDCGCDCVPLDQTECPACPAE